MTNLKTNEELIKDIDFNLRMFLTFFILSLILFVGSIIWSTSIIYLPSAILSLGLAVLFEVQRNGDLIRLELRMKGE